MLRFVHTQRKQHKKGICIGIPKHYEVIDTRRDKEGRFIIVTIKTKLDNIDYLLATYYGPNNDDLPKIVKLFSIIETLNVTNLILAGDFN